MYVTTCCVLGAYVCVNMVLITLSSFLSVTVINIYMREDQNSKVPGWLRKVVVSHGRLGSNAIQLQSAGLLEPESTK